jgi:hypothetical protein
MRLKRRANEVTAEVKVEQGEESLTQPELGRGTGRSRLRMWPEQQRNLIVRMVSRWGMETVVASFPVGRSGWQLMAPKNGWVVLHPVTRRVPPISRPLRSEQVSNWVVRRATGPQSNPLLLMQ